MALFIGVLVFAPAYPRRLQPNGRVRPGTVTPARTGIEPNTDQWYEIAQLPRIGEIVAKRLVAFRRERERDAMTARPLFSRPADLMQIKGIGIKTVQRIGPFLRFPSAHPGR